MTWSYVSPKSTYKLLINNTKKTKKKHTHNQKKQ